MCWQIAPFVKVIYGALVKVLKTSFVFAIRAIIASGVVGIFSESKSWQQKHIEGKFRQKLALIWAQDFSFISFNPRILKM